VSKAGEDSSEIILTGGVDLNVSQASRFAYKLNLDEAKYVFNKLPDMKQVRYGHSQVALDNACYVIGGFCHDDFSGNAPQTLKSCEKFENNEWKSVANLNLARAYAGCCAVPKTAIYIFGGLNGYETTNQIEQFIPQNNSWMVLSIKMPIKIAKLGAACVNAKTIILCGGIYGGESDTNFQYINSSYKFELGVVPKIGRFEKMIAKRTLYSTLPVYKG